MCDNSNMENVSNKPSEVLKKTINISSDDSNDCILSVSQNQLENIMKDQEQKKPELVDVQLDSILQKMNISEKDLFLRLKKKYSKEKNKRKKISKKIQAKKSNEEDVSCSSVDRADQMGDVITSLVNQIGDVISSTADLNVTLEDCTEDQMVESSSGIKNCDIVESCQIVNNSCNVDSNLSENNQGINDVLFQMTECINNLADDKNSGDFKSSRDGKNSVDDKNSVGGKSSVDCKSSIDHKSSVDGKSTVDFKNTEDVQNSTSDKSSSDEYCTNHLNSPGVILKTIDDNIQEIFSDDTNETKDFNLPYENISSTTENSTNIHKEKVTDITIKENISIKDNFQNIQNVVSIAIDHEKNSVDGQSKIQNVISIESDPEDSMNFQENLIIENVSPEKNCVDSSLEKMLEVLNAQSKTLDNVQETVEETHNSIEIIENFEESQDDSVEIIDNSMSDEEKTTEQILQEINKEIFNLEHSQINEAKKGGDEIFEVIEIEDEDSKNSGVKELEFVEVQSLVVPIVDTKKFEENLKINMINDVKELPEKNKKIDESKTLECNLSSENKTIIENFVSENEITDLNLSCKNNEENLSLENVVPLEKFISENITIVENLCLENETIVENWDLSNKIDENLCLEKIEENLKNKTTNDLSKNEENLNINNKMIDNLNPSVRNKMEENLKLKDKMIENLNSSVENKTIEQLKNKTCEHSSIKNKTINQISVNNTNLVDLNLANKNFVDLSSTNKTFVDLTSTNRNFVDLTLNKKSVKNTNFVDLTIKNKKYKKENFNSDLSTCIEVVDLTEESVDQNEPTKNISSQESNKRSIYNYSEESDFELKLSGEYPENKDCDIVCIEENSRDDDLPSKLFENKVELDCILDTKIQNVRDERNTDNTIIEIRDVCEAKDEIPDKGNNTADAIVKIQDVDEVKRDEIGRDEVVSGDISVENQEIYIDGDNTIKIVKGIHDGDITVKKQELKIRSVDINKERNVSEIQEEQDVTSEMQEESNVKTEIQEELNVESEIKKESNVITEIQEELNAKSEIQEVLNVNTEIQERNVKSAIQEKRNVTNEIQAETNDTSEIKVESNVKSEIEVERNDKNEVQTEPNVRSEIQGELSVNSEIQEQNITGEMQNVMSKLQEEQNITSEIQEEELENVEDHINFKIQEERIDKGNMNVEICKVIDNNDRNIEGNNSNVIVEKQDDSIVNVEVQKKNNGPINVEVQKEIISGVVNIAVCEDNDGEIVKVDVQKGSIASVANVDVHDDVKVDVLKENNDGFINVDVGKENNSVVNVDVEKENNGEVVNVDVHKKESHVNIKVQEEKDNDIQDKDDKETQVSIQINRNDCEIKIRERETDDGHNFKIGEKEFIDIDDNQVRIQERKIDVNEDHTTQEKKSIDIDDNEFKIHIDGQEKPNNDAILDVNILECNHNLNIEVRDKEINNHEINLGKVNIENEIVYKKSKIENSDNDINKIVVSIEKNKIIDVKKIKKDGVLVQDEIKDDEKIEIRNEKLLSKESMESIKCSKELEVENMEFDRDEDFKFTLSDEDSLDHDTKLHKLGDNTKLLKLGDDTKLSKDDELKILNVDNEIKLSEFSTELESNKIENNLIETIRGTNKINETISSINNEIEKSERNNNNDILLTKNKLKMDCNEQEKLSINELKSPQVSPEIPSNNSPPSVEIAPLEFNTNDDIRNKIKQQLELLRCMKKPVKIVETERKRKSRSTEKNGTEKHREGASEKNQIVTDEKNLAGINERNQRGKKEKNQKDTDEKNQKGINEKNKKNTNEIKQKGTKEKNHKSSNEKNQKCTNEKNRIIDKYRDINEKKQGNEIEKTQDTLEKSKVITIKKICGITKRKSQCNSMSCEDELEKNVTEKSLSTKKIRISIIRKSKDDENSWTIEKNSNDETVPNLTMETKKRITMEKSKDTIESDQSKNSNENVKQNQLVCVDIKRLMDPQEGSSARAIEKSINYSVPTNLNDVLLSNEGDHLIVSVVGGYKSDDDKQDTETNEPINLSDIESNENVSNFSITETLLKRDLTYKRINDEINAIKPTKTNDITKIKGWRTKTFTIPSDLTEVNNKLDSDNEVTIEEHSLFDPGMTKSIIKDYIDSTQPCTSKDIIEEEKKSEKPNKNSVFVSDMLDNFLTNDAELKISYEVPKLVAEECVSQPSTDIIEPIITNTGESTRQNTSKPTRTNELVVKPKTVAEKRKLLELERKNKLVNTMEQNENIYLKQLEKEDIRNSVVKSIRNNMIKENIPFTKRCWKLANKNEQTSQHIVCNGQKIKILGSIGGDDVILTDSIKRTTFQKLKTENNKKKSNNLCRKIEYKPGPLSKKYKLIKSMYLINHEYEVKKMPKIKLVIFAKPGKRIPHLAERYLQVCKDEKGMINNEWAKFAASAVVSKRVQEKKITKVEFEIPYANHQNKILLRRIVTKAPEKKPVVKYPLVHVENEIKDIVSSMLDTIDNQSLDKVIIKDDPDLEELSKDDKPDIYKSDVSRSSSPVDSLVQTIIKRRNTRKSRTTLELRRLNVQVIEVDVEDNKHEDYKEVCKKPYCRLGCICKSLSGIGSTMPDHCGREGCMFQCTCTVNASQQNHHSVTLPPGTDLLSTSTMVRLQDEAVKHLAKEEKKFTQTVIKANNQTIVVGSGTRERQKRVTKLPKKYTDYINPTDDLITTTIEPPNVTPEEEPNTEKNNRKLVPIWNSLKMKPRKKTQQKPTGWYVKLEKLDIPNVLPWCMVHNLYKCYCGGKGDDVKPNVVIKKVDDDYDSISYTSRYGNKNQESQRSQVTIKKISQGTKGSGSLTVKKLSETEELCARTRILNSNRVRYLQKSKKGNKEMWVEDQVKTEDKKRPLEIESMKDFSVKRIRKSIDQISKPESVAEQKIVAKPYQTRTVTKSKCNVDESLKEHVKIASLIDYTRSYMGLIIPTANWVEKFQKMLNLVSANIRYIRLLQWNCMVERYKSNLLQLWWNNVGSKSSNNVVFTENKKRPSTCHMNIKMFERTSIENFKIPEIIRSILENKLPGSASKAEETYVILVYYGADWEARGTIVLNNTSEQCKSQLSHKTLPKLILTVEQEREQSKDVCYITKNKRQDPEQQSILISKNMSNQYATLQPTKRKAPFMQDKKLSKIDNLPHTTLDRDKIKKILLSYLPSDTQIARWFVLKLENNFSVLKISATQFHIKYSHLITAIQMANKNKKTVRIRSHSKVADLNDNNKFGLYAIPGCNDKIFFGPYGPYEDHGLETYRYLNGKLYNTKTYNMMMGHSEIATSGFWLSNAMLQGGETDKSNQNVMETINPIGNQKPKIEFVDLTENDSDEEDKTMEPKNESNDPLYSLLTADFSKNLSEVTIQRKTTDEKSSEYIDVGNTIKTIHLPLKKNVNEIIGSKRSLETEVINLDEDEASEGKKLKTVIETNKDKKEKRQIPQLYPINSIKNIEQKSNTKYTSILKPIITIIYVTSRIPGFGYIEVLKCDDQYSVPAVNDSKYKKKFKDLSSTIMWLDKILKIKMFHFPPNLSLSLSSVSENQPLDIPKFNENYLNGCHLVCERGIFDLLIITKEKIKDLGFDRSDLLEILKFKCSALVTHKIQILGISVGMDPSQIGDSKILNAAARYIKDKEEEEHNLLTEKNSLIFKQKEMLTKISFLLNGIPSPQYKSNVSKTVQNILKNKDDECKLINEAQKLPAGTTLKIVNGSIVNINNTPQSLLKNKTIPSNVIVQKNPKAMSVLIPKNTKKLLTITPKNNENTTGPMKLKFKLVNGYCRVPVSKLKEVSNGSVQNLSKPVDKLVTDYIS